MTVVEVKEALQKNPYFTKPVIEDIAVSLEIITQVFPDIDFDLVAKRLETLTIEKSLAVGDYNLIEHQDDKIIIDATKLNEGEIDGFNVYTQIIYRMAKSEGMDDAFKALNVGIAELLANYTCGYSNTSDEVALCDLLSNIIGNDVIMNAYLHGTTKDIYRAMIDKGMTEEEITNLVRLANYNYESKPHREKSQLYYIQKELMAVRFRSLPTEEELDEFRSRLRTKSAYYDKAQSQYTDIDTLDDEFRELYDNYKANQSTNQSSVQL